MENPLIVSILCALVFVPSALAAYSHGVPIDVSCFFLVCVASIAHRAALVKIDFIYLKAKPWVSKLARLRNLSGTGNVSFKVGPKIENNNGSSAVKATTVDTKSQCVSLPTEPAHESVDRARPRLSSASTVASTTAGLSDKTFSEEISTSPTPSIKSEHQGLPVVERKSQFQQWRSIINKFTPEKSNKLSRMLLDTLPAADTDEVDVGLEEKLDNLFTLIFDVSSRQHQYTNMYTDLVCGILVYVQNEQPQVDGNAIVWRVCQISYQSCILSPPRLPLDLAEEERMDKAGRQKEKMVGVAKLTGTLVARGMVPCEDVADWVVYLLNGENSDNKRELYLEILCSLMACVGPGLDNDDIMTLTAKAVFGNVLDELVTLSTDNHKVSLRIRCLIKDLLDLREADWQENDNVLKPCVINGDDAEDVKDAKNDVIQKVEFDLELLDNLYKVGSHHLELIENGEYKLNRTSKIIKNISLDQKFVVVLVKSQKLRYVARFLSDSISNRRQHVLDVGQPMSTVVKQIQAVAASTNPNLIVMACELCTRQAFEMGQPAQALVHFDFPASMTMYLYQLHVMAGRSTDVFTFFSQKENTKTVTMVLATTLKLLGLEVPEGMKGEDRLRGSRARGKRGGKRVRARRNALGLDDADDEKAENSHNIRTGKDHQNGSDIVRSDRGETRVESSMDCGIVATDRPTFGSGCDSKVECDGKLDTTVLQLHNSCRKSEGTSTTGTCTPPFFESDACCGCSQPSDSSREDGHAGRGGQTFESVSAAPTLQSDLDRIEISLVPCCTQDEYKRTRLHAGARCWDPSGETTTGVCQNFWAPDNTQLHDTTQSSPMCVQHPDCYSSAIDWSVSDNTCWAWCPQVQCDQDTAMYSVNCQVNETVVGVETAMYPVTVSTWDFTW